MRAIRRSDLRQPTKALPGRYRVRPSRRAGGYVTLFEPSTYKLHIRFVRRYVSRFQPTPSRLRDLHASGWIIDERMIPPTRYYVLTRSTYSPVRVSILTTLPISMKAGHWNSAPVSTLTGFVTLVAVLPFALGSQYSTLSST